MPAKAAKKTTKKDPKAAASKKDAKATKGGKAPAKKDAKKDPKNAKKDPKAATAGKKGGKKDASKKDAKAASKVASPKGVKSPKGDKVKSPKAAKVEQKEEELTVDIGPPVELPQTEDFVTVVPPLKEFELKEDEIVDELKAQFETFQKLLKERKKACLLRARILVAKENEDTPPICIDIEGMKRMIQSIGIPRGQKEYDVMKQRTKVLDKAKELLAYEAKLASVTKKLEATNKETIETEIKECEAVLGEAEPVLVAAKEALGTISSSALSEIRKLPKPNQLLVDTVTACAIMVGKPESECDTWPKCKSLLKTSFIESMLKFQARDISAETRNILETKYLYEGTKMTYENVQKANAVAGNMVKWLEAQLKYNEFIPKVEPMQAKLKQLQVKLLSMEGIAQKYQDAIAELNKRVEVAKGELRAEGKAFDQVNAVLKTATFDQE